MGFVTSTSLRVTCFVCYKNFQDRNLHGRKNRLSVCILYLGRPTDTQHRSCFVCLCSKMYHSPDCWACIKRCFFSLNLILSSVHCSVIILLPIIFNAVFVSNIECISVAGHLTRQCWRLSSTIQHFFTREHQVRLAL